MAPTPRGRPGRPRKSDSLTASAAGSRASSTRRSVNATAEPAALSNPTRTTRSRQSGASTKDISMTDAPQPKATDAKDKNQHGSRNNSVSSIADSEEPSDYSTPGTSAVATPAEQPKPTTTRRGRRTTIMEPALTTAAVNAAARARALRNSEFALNAGTSSNKRKRVIQDSEDDSGNDSIANAQLSADAHFARELQKKEDAAAASMFDNVSIPTRSTPRKPQKIARKAGFISDFDDEDFAMTDLPKPASGRCLKVELGAKGSNSVSFTSKKTTSKTMILDSEEDDAISVPDSDDTDDSDFDAPVAISTALAPKAKAGKMPTKKVTAAVSSARKALLSAASKLSKPTKSPHFAKNTRTSLSRQDTKASTSSALSLDSPLISDSEFDSVDSDLSLDESDSDSDSDVPIVAPPRVTARITRRIRSRAQTQRDNAAIEGFGGSRRSRQERKRLVLHHPELLTMWDDLEKLAKVGTDPIEQPANISRQLKPFQLEGVGWMKAMEKTDWGGGLLGDEMGMGKTIQAVSLIMSDWPAKQPSLVLIPPVALMQWQQEIADYTDGTLKTFVYHGTNAKTKGVTKKELMKYDVILMSYNSLESMYRKQEKGFKRKAGLHKEESVIHSIHFHRVILDEAHNIKQRTTGSAKACFALIADHKWCLSGTPLQNRIGEFFSLVRFLDIKPFAGYFCKQCPCSTLNWEMGKEDNRCTGCHHSGMQHVSVFNQELLNPIQKYGNSGPGKEAFRKLRILTDRFMLRRIKRDHSSAMELPAKEIYVHRQFFGEEENDFAGSIMNNSNRKFETYVAQGVLLNNYANIFGLIMQMRQVADHPDLILKKNGEGGQNILVCCICDESAEDAIRSVCRHDFCRACAKTYVRSQETPDCPVCHIQLSIDLEQEEHVQDENMVKKSSIINRIKMENWTSSSKIETLVHELHQLRSRNMSHKSIIFSQFTTMLQLVEWRLRRAGITTVMLDGSMTPAQRQASINHFMTDINVECFLVSLKAGGVALNLTEASKVFIVDPWWNPAAEWQSADRCHRIGQSRPCSITRLCIEDSVESRMVLLQEKKANMIRSTINADQGAMDNLSTEDMQFLFRGN